ncbi:MULTISPECIES: PadR family transcriptional regulator [unclassified Caulobacter]|uniref:PadR family transcriptional regulator n=1 Tax=unclassified Caulobacter TaxID=2648921 RepID=UPI0009EAE38C|nr:MULTISPECIES: helix-turn-helix transcriptional regulator [unclassified Caulobacter]
MVTRNRQLSPQTTAVLGLLADNPEHWLYGLELSRASGLKSGSLYPILVRLADRGLLESRWLEPEKAGRPPRHAYRITARGKTALRDARSLSTLKDLKVVPG